MEHAISTRIGHGVDDVIRYRWEIRSSGHRLIDQGCNSAV
jgi:hypothetical protein